MNEKVEIIVYLDSSDYSSLCEAPSGSEAWKIKNHLLDISHKRQATFVYSSTHVCEMAPLAPEAARNAIKRTDLLSQLCGKNALISLDALISAEVNRLRNRSEGGVDAISRDGSWFPSVDGIISALDGFQEHVQKEVRNKLAGIQLNRNQRRRVNSQNKRGCKIRGLRDALIYSPSLAC